MDINRIFFVGLGGAGQRHLRIFRQLLPQTTEFSAFRSQFKTPLLKGDFSVDKSSTVEEKYNLKLFDTLEEGLDNQPDLIVISTPTAFHLEVAKKAAKNKTNLFIEKPFSNNLVGFEEFEREVLRNELCFFVSFQRRFHFFLRKIKYLISNKVVGEIVSARFNVTSFVPDWHPFENFKELYACRKDLGGGVLLTEIHELDLCCWYFGLPSSVYCLGGNYSGEIMDVEDTVHVTLDYGQFAASIDLSFMLKPNRRGIYIGGTEGYIEWDSRGNTLTVENYVNQEKEFFSDPNYSNDAMFIAQASYFLSEFEQTDEHYLEATKASLMLVGAAKESMSSGEAIKIQSCN